MTERDGEDTHEALADDLDDEAKRLKRESVELEDEIDDVRQDVQAKRREGLIADPPPQDESQDA